MTAIKKTVYLPVKVEDELPSEYTRISLSMDGGKTFPFETSFVKWLDYKKEGYTHWLKPQEVFVFTSEQLNEYTANVIKQALETAAEKAYAVGEGSNLTTKNNSLKWTFAGHIGDVKIDKQSIITTFEETYQKYKI